jgi:hypothetical protein
MPAELRKPDPRLIEGAVVRYDGKLWDVGRQETQGMQKRVIILKDFNDPDVWKLVAPEELKKDSTTLVREASNNAPVADAVPVSLECLLAESRAQRLRYRPAA